MAWSTTPKFDAAIPAAITETARKWIVESAPITDEAWKNIKVRTNKVPTHDPYTNPDAQIYYECGCGEVLDPGVKSFAALNNVAMNSGWKIRWGATHYIAFCRECGQGVE